ncbi:MAG: hypothetical protein CVT80_06665 [Alphaproteobacteria bacterium HGW-Alphaproteobacteria-2]|nr:MAG: hypothetical protein CVT80_06665 [Alphaproteobacteria bacterium HGW-Alphaproteobacteria-2]
MDNPVSDAYLYLMFARVVALLFILAIAGGTTATSAHAARMSPGPDHAVHLGEPLHATKDGEHSCADQHHCGAADAEMCEFVCAGLAVFLTSPGREAGHEDGPSRHYVPSEEIQASRAPGLNERPPKHRLL